MYKEFYGFLEEPFALHPDPKFLYLARSHWEALSSMMSGIKERRGIISITGEVGVGKTILIHALLKDLSERIKTAFIFNPKLDFPDLLKNILRDLEVPLGEGERDPPSLILRFREYLNERLGRDETVTVIIDEAQSLDERVLEELGRLSSPDTPAAKLLQIVLVGQPELEVKLNSEKLRSFKKRIALNRQISPLTREEGRGYLKHRLKLVGRSISEVFTADAVDRVWEFAGGIPRVMNLVCDRALLIGYSDSRPIIDSKIIKEAIKDYDSLRPRKFRALRSLSSGVKSHYKIIGILFLLVFVLGAFYSLRRDSSLPALQIKGRILPSEERSTEKRAEES